MEVSNFAYEDVLLDRYLMSSNPEQFSTRLSPSQHVKIVNSSHGASSDRVPTFRGRICRRHSIPISSSGTTTALPIRMSLRWYLSASLAESDIWQAASMTIRIKPAAGYNIESWMTWSRIHG